MPDSDKKDLSPEEIREELLRTAADLREREIKMLKKWKLEYTFPDPFLQRDLQKYQTRIKKLGATGDDIPVSVFKGVLVTVALELGWLKGMTEDAISGMLPGEITVISNLIHLDVLEGSRVPNE